MPFSYLGGLSSNTRAKNAYISEAHASNALSSAMSAEIKDEIRMEYGSSNSKKSSSSAPKNISSSFTLFDQSQEGQSSSQKEEAKSASLGKPDYTVLAE
jgi:hypothetical protein